VPNRSFVRRSLLGLAAVGLVLAVAVPAAAGPGADLSVTSSDSPDPVVAGGTLTYALTVSNAGPDAAASVVLTEATPAGTTFASLMVPAGWSCTTPAVGATGTVTCTILSLAAATGASFSLAVRVDPGTAVGTTITSSATVASSTPDPDSTDNAATTTSTVGAALDLCTIEGTNKADTLIGTSGDDVICGGNGNDTIDGAGGNDVVVGGNGKDSVTGGEGNDVVQGRNGKDTVTGGPGLDVLSGGNGKDALIGQDGGGGDVLDGGNGKDDCLMDAGDTATSCP
jgi:uncharacterized repeat protein (TIGR01451 family)